MQEMFNESLAASSPEASVLVRVRDSMCVWIDPWSEIILIFLCI